MGDENALLDSDLFCPGLLAMGGFQTPAMLVAGHPVCMFQTGDRFPVSAITAAYQAARSLPLLQLHKDRVSDAELADWAAAHVDR